MEFEEIIVDKLTPIFNKYDIFLTETFKNYVKFKSKYIVIAVSYDVKENNRQLFIGKNDDNLYLFDGNAIQYLYGIDVFKNFIIPELSVNDFIKNLIVFFNSEGNTLLFGDNNFLDSFEKYSLKQSVNYNSSLVLRQKLSLADKYWDLKDYHSFIEIIQKINNDVLPKIYRYKFDFACNSIK